MFTERTLLYFQSFYFKNGGHKPKFFLVLKQMENTGVLASLPSSQDYVPSYAEVPGGCVELPEANFNCFCFEAGKIIIDEGNFSFPKPTYLYGHLLDVYDSEYFESYPIEGIDYQIKGKLSKELFREVIECFKESRSVKRKYKRLLGEG